MIAEPVAIVFMVAQRPLPTKAQKAAAKAAAGGV